MVPCSSLQKDQAVAAAGTQQSVAQEEKAGTAPAGEAVEVVGRIVAVVGMVVEGATHRTEALDVELGTVAAAAATGAVAAIAKAAGRIEQLVVGNPPEVGAAKDTAVGAVGAVGTVGAVDAVGRNPAVAGTAGEGNAADRILDVDEVELAVAKGIAVKRGPAGVAVAVETVSQ